MARQKKNPEQNEAAPKEEVANEVSRAEYLKFVREAPVVDISALEAQVKALAEQNAHLMAALVGTRLASEEKKADEVLYDAICVGNAALTAELEDSRGLQRTYHWDHRGAVQKLTTAQVKQLQEKSPHWFTRGLISIPEVVDENPNVIADLDAFLASVTSDTLNARVAAITSIDTLYALFHHIETMRFEEEAVKDANGMLTLPTRDLPPLVIALQALVIRRLAALANVNATLEN